MKNKMSVVFCVTLLVVSVFPMMAIGCKANSGKQDEFNPLPISGCIEGDKPEFKVETKKQFAEVPSYIKMPSKSDDIVDLILQIDEQMIYDYINDLISFGPRVTGEPACEDAAAYIYNEFEQMGLQVRYDDWNYSGYASSNVEAILPGADQTSDDIYVVCGHYDSVPGVLGADDDASGVAVTLAAAHVISQCAFNHTIRFVAFSGEEEGLLGSYMYVQEAIDNGDNIVATLNADMIGYAITANDGKYMNIYENEESMWLFDFTNNTNQQFSEYIGLQVIPTGFSWGSDHYYFWEYGYSAIFYAEYNFNPYWHTTDDTIENMNMTYDVKGTRLILATLAGLAQLGSVNLPPDTPSIAGPAKGKVGKPITYTFVTTDPEGNDIYYSVDWGDGSDITYVGPYASDQDVALTHTWAEKGTYIIKAKAKDTYGADSGWGILEIKMPRNKILSGTLMLKILERFPHAFPILRELLKV
ncbi:MAG: M28 family peptidase [Euryarchaeota archaeon]|nr:M28 family peptidase [Euryarchaeota archaeon]